MAVNPPVPLNMFKSCLLLLCLLLAGRAAVAGTRHGYIAAGHLKLYYETQGQGPAVVLLHGGYLDLHSWDHEAAELAGKYQVIRFDLPGHGKTTGIDTAIKIEDVVSILLDSLHIRKASFIGLSLGGACAADFAVAYPARVRKLVLVSAGLSGWQQVMQLDSMSKHLFIHSDSVFLSKDHQQITENFTHLWCDGPFRKPDEVSPAERSYIYRTVAVNVSHNNNSWPVFNTDRAAKKVHTLTCPVLILAGDKDVPFILTVARFYHRQAVHSQLHIVKGAAHMVNLEKPVVFHHYVGDFLGS